MSWTTPFTAVAGSVYTAAQWNTYGRDNLLALRALPDHRCNAYHNTTQVVTAGNTDSLSLNSEVFDTAAMHDVSTNNSRITIQSGGDGFYWIYGMTIAAQTSATTVTARLHVAINGSIVATSSITSPDSNLLQPTSLSVFWGASMEATDYIELYGEAIGQAVTFGSSTAARATRLQVIGPLPPL